MFRRRRYCVLLRFFDQPLLLFDLHADLRLMIEVVGHCGVHFGWFQVGVMDTDFVSGPTVIQIVDHDLYNPNTRQSAKARWALLKLLDVWVTKLDGHSELLGREASLSIHVETLKIGKPYGPAGHPRG